MISYVRGTVAATNPDQVVLDVGGIGFALQCTPTTIASLRLGLPATLTSSLVVREDSLTLYGFADEDERQVFDMLQTATGVGPRLAQAALAVHTPDALRRAVADEDVAALMRVPGIGRKGAQRICIELRDRLGPPSGSAAEPTATTVPAAWRDQVHAALVGLGWSTREADRAVDAVADDAAAGASTADLLRAALRTLDRST